MSVTEDLERWVARGSGPYTLSLRQAERLVRDECVIASGGTALAVPMTLSYAFGPGLDWERLDAHQAEPLDLFRGPLVWLAGARIRPAGETWVQLTVEHMIFDGLSEAVLMERLRDAYNGLAREPAGLAGTAYRDFVARQWDLVDSEEGRARLAFWRSRLSAGQARPGFSLSPAYSPEETSCGWLHADLPESVAGDLAAAARVLRTTAFSLIAAAVLLAMRRYAADRPLGFVCPIANRSTKAEFHAIGNFSDYMVIRTDQLARNPGTASAVSLVLKAVAEGLSNHYPWSTLVRELEPDSFIRPDPRQHLSLSYLGEAAADSMRDFRLKGVQGARIREASSSTEWPPHPLTLSLRRVGGLRIDLGYRGLADPAPAVGFLSDCSAELRRVAGATAG